MQWRLPTAQDFPAKKLNQVQQMKIGGGVWKTLAEWKCWFQNKGANMEMTASNISISSWTGSQE